MKNFKEVYYSTRLIYCFEVPKTSRDLSGDEEFYLKRTVTPVPRTLAETYDVPTENIIQPTPGVFQLELSEFTLYASLDLAKVVEVIINEKGPKFIERIVEYDYWPDWNEFTQTWTNSSKMAEELRSAYNQYMQKQTKKKYSADGFDSADTDNLDAL